MPAANDWRSRPLPRLRRRSRRLSRLRLFSFLCAAAERLSRVLWNDPATGVMRHADAGYEIAEDCARTHALNLPMKA